MRFFDKNFFKVTFQFLVIVFLGLVAISYISSLSGGSNVTAGVVDGR